MRSDVRTSTLVDGICELTLQASEPDVLEGFYCQVFGCEVISREEDRVWLACGSHTRLGLWTPGKKEFGDSGGAHVHYAFSAPSGQLGAVQERLDRLGVAYEGPVEHEGGDRSIYVEDPEGNVVEVWTFFERGEGEREGIKALR